jgi:fatty acid elongase 3
MDLINIVNIVKAISEYEFSWKTAPFSSFEFALSWSVGYVAFVLLYIFSPQIKKILYMKDTRHLVAVHNVILCLGSLVMCLGVIYEATKRSYKENSVDWLFCEHITTEGNGMLFFWSYIYYLSKFYELLDTALQFLSGKTPPNFFLHVYHHSCVILMSWAWINSQAGPQFIGITFNTAVHVVMYYYFYLKSIGITPSWKKYVTTFQVVQFMFSILFIGITFNFAWNRKPEKQCKGLNIVIGSLFFNVTLLYGFIQVLQSNNTGTNSSKTVKKRT